MSENHPGRATTIALGLLSPGKDIGNLELSDSDQKLEFQFLACF